MYTDSSTLFFDYQVLFSLWRILLVLTSWPSASNTFEIETRAPNHLIGSCQFSTKSACAFRSLIWVTRVACYIFRWLTLIAILCSSTFAIPLNINLGAYSPAVVIGDGALSFGAGAEKPAAANPAAATPAAGAAPKTAQAKITSADGSVKTGRRALW